MEKVNFDAMNDNILTDQNVEEQEILGSVTQSIDTQNGEKSFPVTVRTSARVSKKLRLDSQIASAQEKPPEKKADKTDVKSKDTPQQQSASKRINGLWSTEDKNVFFKALNEFGKDFVAIQTHMNNKMKKRGISQNVVKNKDQARHFYYRTWHKISKYVKFPADVKKATQELYGLINFGEFRKRIGFFSEKYAMKLNELIYSGTTQMRVRGKTVRIKTPVCRALRKLNQLEECPEDIKLPTRITIELRPRDNNTWFRVQMLSMNPRVRTTLPLHARLISLIEYLQNKWQSLDIKTKNKVLGANSTNGDSVRDMVRTNDSAISLLRLAPREGVSIVAPSVGAGEFITSSRISLLSYEEKFGSGGNTIADMLKQLNVATPRGQKSSKSVKKQLLDEEKNIKPILENESLSVVSTVDDLFPQSDNFVSMTVQQLLALNSETDLLGKYGADDSETSPLKDEYEAIDHITEITTSEKKEEIIGKAKAGWNVKNAESARIGDLYLMFGNSGKLQLEYWWEEPTSPTNVSNILQKLLAIAKTTYDKDKVFCPCGHVCKSNNKMGINSRSKTVTKTVKYNTLDLKNSLLTENEALNKPAVTAPSVGFVDTIVQPEVTQLPNQGAGMESFRDQIFKLQPRYLGRRRRLGDRQTTVVPRLVPLFSQPSVNTQNTSPVQNDVALTRTSTVVSTRPRNAETIPVSTKTEALDDNVSVVVPISHASNSFFSTVINNTETTLLGHNVNIQSSISSTVNSGSSEEVVTSTTSSSLMLDQDEDSRLSSCSSLGRFIEALTQPCKDEITTPVLPTEMKNKNPTVTSSKDKIQDGSISPHWLYSEGSNLSFSSLLAELDHTAAQLKSSSETVVSTADVTNSVDQLQHLINEDDLNSYSNKFGNITSQDVDASNCEMKVQNN